jgi:DNA-binding NtrC family response regulator
MTPSLNSEIVPITEVPVDESVTAGELRPQVVLVVDDEPLVADTLSKILSNAGFATMTAYDGPTALELAGDDAPDLLISDVAMPAMNGVELALAMLEEAPECKVLLFSGHATSADLVRALDQGHDFPLLAKPLHPTEMLRHVARTLKVPERGMPDRGAAKRKPGGFSLRPQMA